MDISIDRGSIATIAPQTADMAAEAAKAGTKQAAPAGFSVTNAAAAPEDAAAAEISEASLTRNDPLGKLVGAAFSMPAPPMPQFD